MMGTDMCKTGGPRCDDTQEKKYQRQLKGNVDTAAKKAGVPLVDWKQQNLAAYDAMIVSSYGGEVTQRRDDPLDDETASMIEFYTRLFKGKGYNLSEDEVQEILDSAEEDEEEDEDTSWEQSSQIRPISNRHLLPKNAIIHTPTPNPVFVYGTLREGYGNSILLRGRRARTVSGTIPGAAMHSLGGFPYLLPDDQHQSVGEVVYLDQSQILDTMESLDSLEGTQSMRNETQNHYNRYLWYIKTKDADGDQPEEYTQAWVYMPTSDSYDQVRSLPRVPSGDWQEGVSMRRESPRFYATRSY